jgi:hypothetical protein
MNINVGLEKLSNGYTVLEYMKQTGGDNISRSDRPALRWRY